MKKYINILKKCRLFYGIEDEDILRMLTCMGTRVASFEKKYTIFREGSAAKYIGIVLSGTAQTVRVDYSGNRSIISEAGPSETFGEAFACVGMECAPVSVIAAEPCEIMFIECEHILHTCQNNCSFHSRLIYNLVRELADKNIRYYKKSEITSARTTREKLLTYLTAASKEEGGTSFDIPFDRQELADYLGVDRSGLSVEIGRLKREGVIDCHKNHFDFLL